MGPTSPTPEYVCISPSTREGEARRCQHPQDFTPASSQTAHLPQTVPSSASLEPGPSVIPSEQASIPFIEGVGPYRRATGQLLWAAGASSVAEGSTQEESPHGRPQVSISVASQTDIPRGSSGQGHPVPESGGIFSNASNFSIYNPTMIETQKAGTQNVGMQNIVAQHVHNHNTEVNPLEKMLLHVIPGAEFNSAVRDPPPKCHPDTRIQIREDLHNRINGTTKLIWMHGPAGVGKSAIMQTIAETVPTCATLFFSRSSDPPRNDSKKVFTTLAYRIAANNAEYREYIEERIYQDPAFLAISLTEQFDRLFTVPFTHNYVQPGSQRWVVLLDGLDECKNEQNDQCRIVDLIGDSNLRHAGDTPFTWVIASRPEAHLMAALRKLKGSFRDRPTEFWELEIPADSNDAAQDIERYLHTEFTKIREGSPDSFPTPASTWPSDGDFLKAARASSGLFVFASTLTKYISVDRPPSRLRLIISLIDRSTLDFTRISQKPFSLLDILYTQIMSDIPEDLLSVAKSLLDYYRLVSEGLISGKGLVIACNILGLCQDEVYDALRKLHSVLKCPSPGSAKHVGIEFFHASFPDFLFDHSRSQCYYVDLEQELTNTWRCYLKILKESCQINPIFSIPNSNSVNIQWVPGDDEPGYIQVQEELLWEAHHGCISLLIEYGHTWCASCPQPKYGRRLLVDAPEFVDVFRGAYSVLFHTDVHLTKKFADWFNDHAPKAIQGTMTPQEFPISQLDTERLFRSLCMRSGYWYVVPGYMKYIDVTVDVQRANAPQWSYLKGELRGFKRITTFDLLDAVEVVDYQMKFGSGTFKVVGTGPSGLYVVVGPICPEYDMVSKVFYVLPYLEM